MLGTLKSPPKCCTILLLNKLHGLIFCKNYCWRSKMQNSFFHYHLTGQIFSDGTEIMRNWNGVSRRPKKRFQSLILCWVLNDLSYPCALSVKTLSITQFWVLRTAVLFLTAPLDSCPRVCFFYYKPSLSTCSLPPVFSTFLQSVVCFSSSLIPPGLDLRACVHLPHSHWLSSQISIVKLCFQFLCLQPSIICFFALPFQILLWNVGSSLIFPVCCFIFLWAVGNW